MSTARSLLATVLEHVPAVIGAILLLLVGWLVARLMRALAGRSFQVVETLVERATGSPAREGVRRSAGAFSTLVFWAVMLFFITAATHVLGLVTFTEWLARLLQYLPTLAAGLLIAAAGFLLARFVGDLVHSAAKRLEAPQRAALARLAQGATLIAALLVGADQVGIRVTWLAVLVVIVLATVLGGVALAVSLGARGYVANLIGSHYLRQAFRIGETVRVAGFEGRILDLTATSLVLDTADGRVVIPARVFNDEPMTLVTGADHE
ncbi:MAG TPA: mechanosensitive ion channel [Steroidobacteraceae bacterium]|nr:mechanosensitive ion channel [Steroidobacteraceae bacterium]